MLGPYGLVTVFNPRKDIEFVPEDHRTVALSITASLASAGVVLLSIALVAGGSPPPDLILRFVVPLIIAALTLSLFWVLLYVRSRSEKRRKTAEAGDQ